MVRDGRTGRAVESAAGADLTSREARGAVMPLFGKSGRSKEFGLVCGRSRLDASARV